MTVVLMPRPVVVTLRRWSESANVFVPRTSSDDFAQIENIWNDGTDSFIKRNEGRLKNLLKSGTEDQKAFIRRLLVVNENPPAA